MNVKNINNDSYITPTEASTLLRQSKSNVYILLSSNKLKYIKLSSKCTLVNLQSVYEYINNKPTKPNPSEIISLYVEDKKSIREIVKTKHISAPVVKRILNNYGFVLRHNNEYKIKNKVLDEHIFDTINSEFSAYFLGLLWADGYNQIQRTRIQISLQEGDEDILKKISNVVYGKEKLYKIIKNGNRKIQYRLDIYNPHISKLLFSYGFNTSRNFHGGLPKCIIDKKHFHHFLRGLWDGDGSIYYINYSKDYATQFIGSPLLCQEIQTKLKEYYNFDICLTTDLDYSSPMARLHIHGNKKTKSFLDIIYYNSMLSMNRKYNMYEKLLYVK